MKTVNTSKEEVKDFIFNVLSKEKQVDTALLNLDTPLKNLEIDSFGFLEVIFNLEHEYDISFPKEYSHIQTLQDLVDVTHQLVIDKQSA